MGYFGQVRYLTLQKGKRVGTYEGRGVQEEDQKKNSISSWKRKKEKKNLKGKRKRNTLAYSKNRLRLMIIEKRRKKTNTKKRFNFRSR